MHKRLALFGQVAGMALVLWWLNTHGHRDQFMPVMGALTVLFVLYAGVLYTISGQQRFVTVVHIAGIGLFLRAMMFLKAPFLSDDCYRFLWDGHLWNQGVHPFACTPRYVLEHLWVPGITAEWFSLLNSPDYYTVYPPVGQFFFRIADAWSGGSLNVGVWWLRVFLCVGEIVLFWGLYRLLMTNYPQRVLQGMALYALNPLAIVEIVGNVHFEGMMMAALVWALVFLQKEKHLLAGIAWAIAIAVKLLPLLLLPPVLGWLGVQRSIRFMAVLLLALAGLFWPLADPEVVRNMLASVHLYFQQFEFNASVYYVLSHISPWFTGWYEGRTIAPVLALLTAFVSICYGYYFWKKPYKTLHDLQKALLLITMVYLFNATTVHPWYVLVPLVCSIGLHAGAPVIWSFACFFSYSHYIGGGRLEHFGWITVEYMLVLGGIIWEWYHPAPAQHTH